jgi:hypothetical protein
MTPWPPLPLHPPNPGAGPEVRSKLRAKRAAAAKQQPKGAAAAAAAAAARAAAAAAPQKPQRLSWLGRALLWQRQA